MEFVIVYPHLIDFISAVLGGVVALVALATIVFFAAGFSFDVDEHDEADSP